MRRIGIFAFYDRSGKVNQYVKYLLKEIRSLLSYLIIVCNGEISEDGKRFFENCSDYFVCRENVGYDAGAYQEVILQETVQKVIQDYDELLLFNNTFYGPVFPFTELFDVMHRRKFDFWGISARDEGTLPYHIQSYFILITKKILRNPCFLEYWKTQREISSYKDAVYHFELRFTQYFLKRGYCCDVYMDMKKLRKIYDMEGNLISKAGYEIIEKYRFPIIKRKHVMEKETGALLQNSFDLFEFLKEKTDYNTDYIWEDLIDHYSPYELTTYRYLYFFLADDKLQQNKRVCMKKKYFIIFSQRFHDYVTYIKMHFHHYKILVIVETEINDLSGDIMYIPKNISSFWKILEQCMRMYADVPYWCILTDPENENSNIRMERYIKDICKKMVASENYVSRIFQLFEEQKKLGMFLPEPYFDLEQLKSLGTGNVLPDEMLEWIEQFQWSSHTEKNEIILQNTNCFWCRACVLKSLFATNDWKKIQEKNLFSILPYWLKHESYYVGILNHTEYTKKEFSLKTHILNQIFMRANNQIGLYNLENEYDNFFKASVIDFAKRYHGVYLYGTGQYAKNCLDLLQKNEINILGVVVSAGKTKEKFMFYDIFDVKELNLREREGIIIAMSKVFQQEVKGYLEKFPVKDIYFL